MYKAVTGFPWMNFYPDSFGLRIIFKILASEFPYVIPTEQAVVTYKYPPDCAEISEGDISIDKSSKFQ